MLADDLVEEVALAAHAAEPAAAQPSDTEVGSGTPRSDGDAAPGGREKRRKTTEGHDVATPALSRPAAQAPVTEEEGADALKSRMAVYNQLKQRCIDAKTAKPDMVACKEMYEQGLMPPMNYGLVLGAPPGSEFKEKGELEVARLHNGIMRGIGWPKDLEVERKGAYSIVMSGAYHDDKDDGDEFTYTGMGLGSSDQEYKSGNLALKYNISSGEPVRVIRRVETKGTDERGRAKKNVSYVYEGLYNVMETWLADSVDKSGRKVILFRMKKHRDNTKEVTASVAFRPQAQQALLWAIGRQNVSLVGKRPRAAASKKSIEEKEAERLIELQAREGVLCEDISNGKERVRIPVINTEDSEQIPNIQYVTKTVLSAAVAPSIESAAASADRFYMPLMTKPPALAKNTYFHNPLILGETHVYGIDEIDAPPKYKVVASGVRLPLEVFKTPGGSRGWGVRCTEFIPGGTFVCEYAGHLLTHADAEALGKEHHHYFFGMDHYHHMVEYLGDQDLEGNEALQALGAATSEEERAQAVERCLARHDPPVIDAQHIGNVGRFLNHSNAGNLEIQPVFTDQNHSVIFYRCRPESLSPVLPS
mmetsp:Transcript_13344/g.34261  ORF Transcript_13344/g.34261 Transcript_13344/m.34261 type:complete len:590 (-) Transcript_13344:617-2386(-)